MNQHCVCVMTTSKADSQMGEIGTVTRQQVQMMQSIMWICRVSKSGSTSPHFGQACSGIFCCCQSPVKERRSEVCLFVDCLFLVYLHREYSSSNKSTSGPLQVWWRRGSLWTGPT